MQEFTHYPGYDRGLRTGRVFILRGKPILSRALLYFSYAGSRWENCSFVSLGSRSVAGLAAGASNAAATTVTIPRTIRHDEDGYPISLPPGTYYIGAIADIYNQVQKSSEVNNTLTGTQIVIN